MQDTDNMLFYLSLNKSTLHADHRSHETWVKKKKKEEEESHSRWRQPSHAAVTFTLLLTTMSDRSFSESWLSVDDTGPTWDECYAVSSTDWIFEGDIVIPNSTMESELDE